VAGGGADVCAGIGERLSIIIASLSLVSALQEAMPANIKLANNKVLFRIVIVFRS
jgi:hypothetical protein